MDYASITHCTSNEQGFEEVEVEYNRTFWQWLFKKPGTKKTWFRLGSRWFLSGKSVPVGVDELIEINDVKTLIQTNSLWHKA
jgi:hypothetical protein